MLSEEGKLQVFSFNVYFGPANDGQFTELAHLFVKTININLEIVALWAEKSLYY